jgi:hypothetical protein
MSAGNQWVGLDHSGDEPEIVNELWAALFAEYAARFRDLNPHRSLRSHSKFRNVVRCGRFRTDLGVRWLFDGRSGSAHLSFRRVKSAGIRNTSCAGSLSVSSVIRDSLI